MSSIEFDAEPEDRITMEIVVDAYNEEEQAISMVLLFGRYSTISI